MTIGQNRSMPNDNGSGGVPGGGTAKLDISSGSVTVKIAVFPVTIDSTSTWNFTTDSYITEFNGSLDNVITNLLTNKEYYKIL